MKTFSNIWFDLNMYIQIFQSNPCFCVINCNQAEILMRICTHNKEDYL